MTILSPSVAAKYEVTLEATLRRNRRLPEMVLRDRMVRWCFIDPDGLLLMSGFRLLQEFVKRTGDTNFCWAVLEARNVVALDPVNIVTGLELSISDNPAEFVKTVNSAVSGFVWLAAETRVFAVLPTSCAWAIYADNDMELAVAGFESDALFQTFLETYGSQGVFEVDSAISQLLSVVFTHSKSGVPQALRQALIDSYRQTW